LNLYVVGGIKGLHRQYYSTISQWPPYPKMW
jgi:hypothetical protein